MFGQRYSHEQLSLMQAIKYGCECCLKTGQPNYSRDQVECLFDMGQTPQIFDVLHSVNTKHSDFNQFIVNLLSGELIATDQCKSCHYVS